MYHTNARKMAQNRGAEIKMREPPREPGEDPWDRAFLYDVLDLALTVCFYFYFFFIVIKFYYYLSIIIL